MDELWFGLGLGLGLGFGFGFEAFVTLFMSFALTHLMLMCGFFFTIYYLETTVRSLFRCIINASQDYSYASLGL